MEHTRISIDFARNLYDDSDPVHDFDHVLRVLRLARRIAQAEGADLAIVETAVLLHDIQRVQPEGEAPDAPDTHTDHALLAADYARELLSAQDPPPGKDFIDAVAHAIAAHRFRNQVTPETIEAKTVFDADKLDAIGAIGIARAYAYGARAGQKLWAEVPDDYDGNGPVHTPHHEYVFKLAKIPARMTTTTGRAIARERATAMRAFFDRIALEIQGED